MLHRKPRAGVFVFFFSDQLRPVEPESLHFVASQAAKTNHLKSYKAGALGKPRSASYVNAQMGGQDPEADI